MVEMGHPALQTASKGTFCVILQLQSHAPSPHYILVSLDAAALQRLANSIPECIKVAC